MVTTTEILPCPPLQAYIRCYTLREFDTLGKDFLKPLPANHEFSFAFTLSGSLKTHNTPFTKLEAASTQHIIGLQTTSKGIAIFNGDIRLFTVQFRPNGFFRLFGIPSYQVTNNVFEASDVIPHGTALYKERLEEAKDLWEMKALTDKFLFAHLKKSKTSDPSYYSITSTSSLIFNNCGNVNIKTLAYGANMSLKNFEIKFTEQVGISPKLFARITRFNYALLLKIKNMPMSWTDISHRCGYYDQTHFIKEFKEFAGNSPGNFYKTTPLPCENYRNEIIIKN